MTLAYIVVIFAPRVYQSEARLMLRVGRESVRLDPTAGDAGDAMSLHRTREHEIQSAIGVMHSREILDRVVDDVGVSACSVVDGATFIGSIIEEGSVEDIGRRHQVVNGASFI